MPATTTVYNLNCEPVFDFGTGPRNITYFNPHGNILVLAGFGGLKGDLEVWDFERKVKIAHIDAVDTTQFGWASSGEHFFTATTAPRLRVSNCLKVWRYTGRLEAEVPFCGPQGGPELNEVLWQPSLPLPPLPKLAYTPWSAAGNAKVAAAAGNKSAAPGQSRLATSSGGTGAYRPPAMRNRPEASIKKIRDDYQPPSNQREGASGAPSEQLSKQALKNKKKREARKKQAGDQKQDDDQNNCDKPTEDNSISSAPPVEAESTGDADKDRKIKNLQKKLQQIENLKNQRDSGKQLEINQIEKIATEAALLKEIDALKL